MFNFMGETAEAVARVTEANIQARMRNNAELAELRQRLADMPPAEQDRWVAHERANLARRIANLEMEQGLLDGVANAANGVLNMGLDAARRANLEAYKREKRADGEAEGVARSAQMKAFFELVELRRCLEGMPPAGSGRHIDEVREDLARRIANLEMEQELLDGVANGEF